MWVSTVVNKEAASKLWRRGVKTFAKIKWLGRRATLIQSALRSSDLEQWFKYPDHCRIMPRKFLKNLWSQSLPPKTIKWETFQAWYWRLFCPNPGKGTFPSTKNVLDVVWPCNCFYSIGLIIRNNFHMHHFVVRPVERQENGKKVSS